MSALLLRYGLGWLLGPAGKAMAVGLALLLVVTYIRQDAYADCQADQLRDQLAQKEIQLAEAQEIAETARERATTAEAEVDKLGDLTDDLISEAGSTCPISDDLRERLREIQ